MAYPRTMSTPSSAWDRQRAALRDEIVRTARGLFVERGFDATTVDDIAAAVGISRRSFFRYFGTKEDVLLTDLVARGEAIAAALAVRPADEDAWTALLTAMVDARLGEPADPEQDLALGRMLLGTPSLRARHLEKQLRWTELLVPLLEPRVPGPEARLGATAVVATVLACLDAATEAFVRSDGRRPIEAELRTALEAAALSAPDGLLERVDAALAARAEG